MYISLGWSFLYSVTLYTSAVHKMFLCRCQYFVFEHSSEYQKVQFKFWEATETFDPNAIAVSVTVIHDSNVLKYVTGCT